RRDFAETNRTEATTARTKRTEATTARTKRTEATPARTKRTEATPAETKRTEATSESTSRARAGARRRRNRWAEPVPARGASLAPAIVLRGESRAQLGLEHLAVIVLRQLGLDEIAFRSLEAGDVLEAEAVELARIELCIRLGHHEGDHVLTPLRARTS